MNRLTLDLEHCYGIKKLTAQIDFGTERVCAIYAQNGVMKTLIGPGISEPAEMLVFDQI